jgi:transcriptional regulator GlxA family with amidase domain
MIRRAFKPSTGPSTCHCQVVPRTAWAQAPLANATLSMSAIAGAGGDEGQSRFAAILRQGVGMTPSADRRERRM